MEESVQKAVAYISMYGMNLLAAVVIFLVGRWLTGVVSELVEKIFRRQKIDETLTAFSKNLVYYGMFVFVLLAALAQLGVQTASLIAVLGAAGFAVGMALQGSLSNFAAGVLIIIFRPFAVGDAIHAGGVTGVVRDIQIFDTVISSVENTRFIVPNSQLMGGVIQNYTANNRRMLNVTVGISYQDDIQKVRKVLLDMFAAEPRILKDPAPVVMVAALADSSVNLYLRPWVMTQDYDGVFSSFLERVKETFDKNGISIPYPQHDIHMIPASTPAS